MELLELGSCIDAGYLSLVVGLKENQREQTRCATLGGPVPEKRDTHLDSLPEFRFGHVGPGVCQSHDRK